MTYRPWWSHVAQWGLWLGIMTLVMGWLGRSRQRPRPAGHECELAHPPSTLIMGLVCFGFFAAIAILSNVYRNKTTTWLTTTVFVGFALCSLPMITDYFIGRHTVSDDGLAYRKFYGASRYLRWRDLRSVRYAPTMKWFRLETNSGDVARISAMLRGLPAFARQLLKHAPREAFDEQTLQLVQATADGRPPSVWA
jgi:hypothetical protein